MFPIRIDRLGGLHVISNYLSLPVVLVSNEHDKIHRYQ